MLLAGKDYEYSFEIETLLYQFAALIDGIVVRRYDKDENTLEREFKEVIKPRYVVGLKQRIFYYLVNKANNYTLPCIGITVSGIKTDKERLAASNQKTNRYNSQSIFPYHEYERPVPITISLKVTLFAKYITDLYQMYGGLASIFNRGNNYISWFVPVYEDAEHNKLPIFEELRNNVIWDMNLNISQRDKIEENMEDIFSGDMGFELQGWLFPEKLHEVGNIITHIGSSIIVTDDLINRVECSGVHPLSSLTIGEDVRMHREGANAAPWVNHFFYSKTLNENTVNILIDEARLHYVNPLKDASLVIDGYNLGEVKACIIPKNELDGEPNVVLSYPTRYNSEESSLLPPDKLDYTSRKSRELRGYHIPCDVQSKNKVKIDSKEIEKICDGEYDIILYNDIDYASVSRCMNKEYAFSSNK